MTSRRYRVLIEERNGVWHAYPVGWKESVTGAGGSREEALSAMDACMREYIATIGRKVL